MGAAPRNDETPVPFSGNRARLLVVDDDRIILDLLKRTFAQSYDVFVASSGAEALQIVDRELQAALPTGHPPIDLLITDQKMPGMTGLELIGNARQRLPELSAILLTAYTDPEDLIAAINEGRVYRYVVKPWNAQELQVTVKNALDAAELRRERDHLARRMERRLDAMEVLVEISAAAATPRSYAQLIELVVRALPRIVSFDVCAGLVVPPGSGGPGPACMNLHTPSTGGADEGMLLFTRDRAIELFNQLVGADPPLVDQDELLVNITGARVRGGGGQRHEARSTLYLPILGPGAQGGVLGLFYLASQREEAFTEDDHENLEVLANHTAELCRRLEQRLHDQRRRMELMVESMVDGVIMTDSTGEIFLINPAARHMLGLQPGAEVSTKILKEQLGFYPFDLVRSRAGAVPLREEVKIGENFLHSIVAPVLDGTNNPVGVVVVLRDITERKALDRRKEEFVSIVSHELRTPLTSITGALDLVLAQYSAGLSDKQRRYLELARDSCNKLNGIVDDLLDVAKSERGKLSLRMGSVDLGVVAREVVDRFRAAAEQKRVALTLRAVADARLMGDADRLTQVLNNLLSNALKFTDEGGHIEIEVFGPEITSGWVGCSVWNDGDAIDEEHRERIFDKFEQIQSASTRSVGGTGLGLAICRGIVDGHGGAIWAEGSQLDRGRDAASASPGARFVCVLPTIPPEAPPPSESPPRPTAPTRTVLAVDDDRFTLYVVKGILLRAGYQVILAQDSDSALTLAREKKPDVISVDLRMPGVDGLALVEILKHDPETRKTPILVISVSEDRERAQSVGADTYLKKPLDGAALLEAVGRLLQERGTRRPKVLLIDDDAGIRMICRDVLESHGYAAREAGDGETGLTEARRFRPELILVDVMMPGMDGFAVAQRLRSERDTALTPIIFLSARGQTADKVRAFKLGAEDYLVKPFDAAELMARVERALARRDLELGASPTTRLPGSSAIEAEIDRRLANPAGDFAFCYLDLDNLKAFNDYYGYAKADGVILQTGDIVREVVSRAGGVGDFIGHIAGDDFVFITTAERVDNVCTTVIQTFDRLVPLYYNKTDRERGYIETYDRYGVLRRFPIMSVSIACVTLRAAKLGGHSDLSLVAAELKQKAKAVPTSSYVRDGEVLWPRADG